MGSVAPVSREPRPHPPGSSARPPGRPESSFRFTSLVLTEPDSLVKSRSTTLSVSLLVHVGLLAAVLITPLLVEDILPELPQSALRAFFVAPIEMAPPPPPPPPAPASRAAVVRPVAPRAPEDPAKFVAPIEVPSEIKLEESGLDIGVEGGVPGGVEGGVPGGVVGGVVGGLPLEAPPTKAVRIGGSLVAPKLVRQVKPTFPPLATAARVSAIIILEAQVDTRGHVKDVRVLRGHPLFDQAALDAVRQWRYQPLLLNGVPTEFILTVTVMFNLKEAAAGQ